MPAPADVVDEESLARAVISALAGDGSTLATAESLTGGWIGTTLTGVPGASAVYRGGLITYATELKATLAGVSAATLRRDGPVAASTAGELALGAARRCEADWGLAVTGVAGPESQDGHPVGQVFVGIARRAGGPGGAGAASQTEDVRVQELALAGSRAEIRQATVVAALSLLLDAIEARRSAR
ncbi:CinA family protein [Microlunatus ginsengisoli]|uniref:CinA family protein n=1 Tax=Microlunatus ginsengisoli TaxID=363863 RepID=A0ABP7AWJ1_9ACTN